MKYDNLILVNVIIYENENRCFCDKLMLRKIKSDLLLKKLNFKLGMIKITEKISL